MGRTLKDLLKLSTESQEGTFEEETTSVDVEEVMAQEEELEEFQAIASETEDTLETIEEAEALEEEVEAKIEEQEALLEKPEEVTETDAVVAQEALKYVTDRLGLAIPAAVSREAAAAAPVDALTVSNEGLKDIAKKIWESIKKAWQIVAANAAKLLDKLIVMIAGVSRNAAALEAKLKAAGDKPNVDTLDEKETAKVVKYLTPLYGMSTNTSFDKVVDDLAEVIEDAAKALKTIADASVKALDEVKEEVDEAKLTEKVAGAFKGLPGKVKELFKKSDKFVGVDAIPEGAEVTFLKADAEGAKALVFVDSAASIEEKVQVKFLKWENKKIEDLVGNKVPAKAELMKALASLVKQGKDVNKTHKDLSDIKKAGDEAIKAVEKLASKETSGKAVKGASKLLRTATSSAVFDLSMSNVMNLRGAVQAAGVYVSKYTKEAPKE